MKTTSKEKVYYAPFILIGLRAVLIRKGWFTKLLYRELDGKCHVEWFIGKPSNVYPGRS